MHPIGLDGEWDLFFFQQGSRRVTHPDQLAACGLEPLPARVPGNVELDLQRAGLIPEPFFGRNIRAAYPYEACQWWYVREFPAPACPPGAQWELVFEGLDTFATVWLNGVEVGRSANMLVEHRFDVTDALRPGGTNRVAVRLEPAALLAREHRYDASTMSWEGREEGLFVRKAPHTWGWDIMPRAVSAGIWRPVRLEPRRPAAIEQLYYWTAAVGPDRATLGVRYQVRSAADDLSGHALQFSGACGGRSFEFEWPMEFVAGGCTIPVADPLLWWPRGYGEPHLYTVTARLACQGEVLAERTERIGIRQVVVERTDVAAGEPLALPAAEGTARVDSPPDPAGHFLFRVNGRPVMVKGTNWVPLDAFHSRDAGRLQRAMELVEDLGCNMVRCWGGNVYEDHAFFGLCDERGVMVWQDFAFACCRYPQTEEFLTRARAEAESVVCKLRNHASLALWCGDNECDAAYASDGLSPAQNRLTREVLPRVVHRCDPFRHYVPSSPYLSPAALEQPDCDRRSPEQHLWGPRGYFKAPFYAANTAHFIGETGYHGCPNVSSIRRFISPEHLWPWQDNAEWQEHSVYHWRHRAMGRDRVRLMVRQVEELFGEAPDTLEQFALASQVAQAEALKFFIEQARLRKWQTAGILWWNVLDGWPQFSDAVVDYYFGKKLGYHYIRRVQQPVCIILGEAGPDGRLPAVVSNDSLRDVEVTYCVRDAESGASLAEGSFASPANENWQVQRLPSPEGERLLLIEWQAGEEALGNHYAVFERPLSFDRYRAWLPAIAALPRPFDAAAVAG